jgi:hypothetical protein
MPIDPRMVKWDEEPQEKAAPNIDPRMVAWDDEKPKAPKASRTDRVLTGMADPIHGGAQLLTKVLPASVVKAGNAANNWLADNTGLVARLPAGGVDQQVREREAAFTQQNGQGFDPFRMAGNILSPANIGLGRALPVVATLVGKIVAGASGGAASAALAPVASGNFAEEKQKQVAAGAAFGGAAPALVSGLARVVSPKASVDPGVQALKKAGITPTIGQAAGGRLNTVEEKLMSVPVVGDAIASARGRSVDQFNRSAVNRGLEKIGTRLPDDVPTGRDAVAYAGDTISDAYNSLLPKMTLRMDDELKGGIQQIKRMAAGSEMNRDSVSKLNKILANSLEMRVGKGGGMTGETLKKAEADLGQKIAQYGASQDPDSQSIANALREVKSMFTKALERQNGQYADQLKAVNSAFANQARVEKAAGALGSKEGVFSPAALSNAIKASDKSARKNAYAKGRAFGQDFANEAERVLGNKVPNSGTTDRLLMGLGGAGLGGYLVDPLIPLGLGAGALMYSRPMQGLLTNALTSRPELAQPVADALRKSATSLAPAAGQIGVGLLK